MKILEIASAEEQLALLRVIFDNAWKALDQQAQLQKRANAQNQPKAKPKPRAVKKGKSSARAIPTFRPIPTASAPITKIANAPSPAPSTAAPSSASKSLIPNSVTTMRDLVDKTQSYGKSVAAKRSIDDGNDRHSTNGSYSPKK